MKTCIKCGGNAYRDADTYCMHDFGEPPEPNVSRIWQACPREQLWYAWGAVARWDGSSEHLQVAHPTGDGAVAAWKERWRWGRALDAFFAWLLPHWYLNPYLGDEAQRECEAILRRMERMHPELFVRAIPRTR